MSLVSVVRFEPRFLPAFVDLNREWIEKHFRLEAMDLLQLEHPQSTILDIGGEMFFLVKDGRAVGTVSLVPHGPHCYELAKMAVSPDVRGNGYGDLLMGTAIQWGKDRGAKKIIILSNTALAPAISLYKKHGFETVRLGKHPDYDRCDIELELTLSNGR